MIRLFLDSSVFFSAAYSAKGHSRDIILLGANEEITLVVSELVIDETRRNLAEISPEKLPFFEQIIEAIPFELIRPTKREITAAASVVALKDAPIVAAAKKSRVDLLVTLDRKHLLERPEVAGYLRFPIVTPLEAVDYIRRQS